MTGRTQQWPLTANLKRCNVAMEQRLISIVVPVYNVELYLNRCVESLVNQTYRQLDIILVDDGSRDACPALCDDWAKKDARIKVVHKSNAGLGMARNTGIDHISGDFVCFVDSDDYLVPDAVERCVAALEKNNTDTVLFGRYDAFPDGTVKEDGIRVTENCYTNERIVGKLLPELFTDGVGYGVSACSKMFSTEILRENSIRFRSEREIISEDSFFCIDYFAKAKTVAVISDRLYCYFKNSNSLSRTFRDDRQKQNNIFLLQGIEHLQTLPTLAGLEVYLKSKYHIFSLAAMKHIETSTLSRKAKRCKLREVYRDPLLRKTVSGDVLRIDPMSIATFMLLIKCRLYLVCDTLLKIKTKNDRGK